MDQEIIARLKKRVIEAGLDGIIAFSPENVTYVSGFVVPSQSLNALASRDLYCDGGWANLHGCHRYGGKHGESPCRDR